MSQSQLPAVNWSAVEGFLTFVIAAGGTLGLVNRIIKIWIKRSDDRYNRRTISWEQLYRDALNKLLGSQTQIDTLRADLTTTRTALASAVAERDALRETVRTQATTIAVLAGKSRGQQKP